MKSTFLPFAVAALFVTTMFAGCKKDKNEGGENEEELITTVKLTLTEAGTSNTSTFTFKDIDGPGGAAPEKFDNIVLASNKTYNFSIELLNESVTPAEDITEEVIEEAGDHQFYYVPAGVNVAVSNLNLDAGSLPLGTTATWTTGGASLGTVKVVLKHKPGQKAVNDPITKGETDIELDFACRVN
jgi:hypothetical protein